MFSDSGWSVYGTGDGTNYINVGYNYYNAYGTASMEVDNNVDTWMLEVVPTGKHGSDNYLRMNAGAAGALCRPLIKFDLTSLAGITSCSSAVMQLTVESVVADPMTYQNLYIAAMLTAWSQTNACWDNSDTGAPWNVAGVVGGSDVRSTPEWTGNITITDEQKVGFDITSLVNEWLSGSLTNNGLIMYSTYIAASQEFDWHSRDSATAAARPKLIVAC